MTLVGTLSGLASAQSEAPPPGSTRSLSVPKVARAPVIDGKLDDEGWRSAAVATGFWISELRRWPTERTEVLVMAGEQNLYVGFRCYDSQPELIQALQARRDNNLGFDDQVVIELDPFHDHRTISNYSVNARGTQNDTIAGGRAAKIEWKGDWRAAAVRTDFGWSVEIAIPFAILNFRPDDRTFGLNFVRYHNRTGEWSRWADVTPQAKPEEMGHLAELDLSTARIVRPWTFMPYGLIGRKIPDEEGHVRDVLVTAGIDIRYEPRQNVTGVLSINPDFSQVESQVTGIDFSYTEKSRGDPRPFFQEGTAYFGSRSYFYSNRVPDFDYGGKLFAQLDRYRLGMLVTEAPDSRWDGALRMEADLDATNTVSAMAVATRSQDLDNQLVVGELTGRQPFGLKYTLDAAFSSTQKSDIGDGGAVSGSLGWQWDYVSVTGSADYYAVDFFPADGLLKADRVGTKGAGLSAGYSREFSTSLVRQLTGSVAWTGRDTLGGLKQNRNWYLGGTVELRAPEIKLGLFFSDGHYRPVGEERGRFTDTVNHDYYWTVSLDFNTRSSWLGYGVSYSSGFLGGGDYGFASAYAWVKPTDRTFINLSTERLDSFGAFDQTVVSAGWDITSEDGVATRYILADGQTFLRFAYRRQVRKGLDIFAVYDREPGSATKLSFKLVWTFP